jgi:ribonuclease-3
VDKGNPALLADAFEAMLGAVYLDSGIEKCREILLKYLFSMENEIFQSEIFQNPKTLLNEKAQELKLGVPIYELLDEWGEIHKREFKVAVSVGKKRFGQGTGFSKKEAEQNAAKKALKSISHSHP